MERVLVIPAAGTGSRLGSAIPKVLVPVNGRPMVHYLLNLYARDAERAIVVVSPSARDAVSRAVALAPIPVSLAVQDAPTGMLDAILVARGAIAAAQPRRVLVTWCDQVGISPVTVARVVAAARETPAPALVMPTCRKPDPYVHLERDGHGRVVRVLHRREGDVMPAAGETDAGVFDMSRECYLEWLPGYAASPEIGARTGERNFVPFVARVARRGTLATIDCAEPEESIGINTPEELAVVEAHLRSRHNP